MEPLGEGMIARRTILGSAAALAFAGGARAQQGWPSRAVKIIVTFPPGGASDAAARVISGPLQEKLGQTVIVDNKPGAGGTRPRPARSTTARAASARSATWSAKR